MKWAVPYFPEGLEMNPVTARSRGAPGHGSSHHYPCPIGASVSLPVTKALPWKSFLL